MSARKANKNLVRMMLVVCLAASAVMSMHTNQEEREEEEEEEERWPVSDDEGYYLAFKSKGRWVNWWGRNRPSITSLLVNIVGERDNSSIPSNQTELDQHLPVKRPYWLRGASSREAWGDGDIDIDAGANLSSSGAGVVGAPGVRATWIGHATVLAEVDGAVVLTDPMFSQRASPSQWFGPRRYRPPACTVEELPDVDAVVISHTHYDHLDYNSVSALNRRFGRRLHWYVPMDMASWLTGNFGMRSENVHELVWWQEATLPGTDVRLICTPSNHWGKRGVFDENKELWGSWTVIGPKSRFWFGGDTAYSDVFRQIGNRYGPFNLTAIPIGAYEPRWFMKHVHVNPAEAVSIHQDIRSLQSVGIHWGTFKLTYEHYLAPRTQIREEIGKKNISAEQFAVVDLGETVAGKVN